MAKTTFLVLIGVAMLATFVVSQTNPSPGPGTVKTPTLPTIPRVFSAEVEFTLPNRSVTFAGFEKYDFNKNLTRMETRTSGRSLTTFLDWTTGQEHIFDPDRGCVTVQRGNTEQIYALTSAMFMLNHPSVQYLYQDELRGILVDVWGMNGAPLNVGGGRGFLDVRWYFSRADWNIMFADGPQLLQVVLNGVMTGGNFSSINGVATIVDVSPSRALAETTFALPAQCGGSTAPSTPAPTNASTVPNAVLLNPMPTLPKTFSAAIETNMRERKRTFTLYQYFSEPLLASRTIWVHSKLDPFQRQIRYETFLVGAFQLAYELVTKVVPAGQPTGFTPDERKMFFPNTLECVKSVFNDTIVGTAQDLLLASAASGARYMGRTTVRGIPTKFWQALTPNYRVTWYFADESWRYSTANASSPTLLRMVVNGRGRSPFFVFHPFYQQGNPVPEAMKSACKLFFGGDLPSCDQDEQFYQHVHEFLSFSSSVDDSMFRLPDKCLQVSQLNAVPYAANCDDGLTNFSIFLLCGGVAIVSGFLTYVYVKLKNKKPDAEEEE